MTTDCHLTMPCMSQVTVIISQKFIWHKSTSLVFESVLGVGWGGEGQRNIHLLIKLNICDYTVELSF